jgi:hypothetical protein
MIAIDEADTAEKEFRWAQADARCPGASQRRIEWLFRETPAYVSMSAGITLRAMVRFI